MSVSDKGGYILVSNDKYQYSIAISQLSLVRLDKGKKISEWVAQLSGKTWVNSDLLYELLDAIKQHHPEADIDWEATLEYIKDQSSRHIYRNLFKDFD